MISKIIKGITITTFLTLVVGFVAYRSGCISEIKPTNSPNSNRDVLKNRTDTSIKIGVPQRPTSISIDSFWMDPASSSKSFEVFKEEDIKVFSKEQNSKKPPLFK